MRSATMSMKVTLATHDRDTPLLSSHLRVELPAGQDLAVDLEEAEDSVAYKSAVQCLLGYDGWYRDDRHDATPRVTKADDKLVLEHDESIDFQSRDTGNLAFVSATAQSGHAWRIDVTPAPALASTWRSDITIEGPLGSVYGPMP